MPARGLMLRALVPAKTAGPCHLARNVGDVALVAVLALFVLTAGMANGASQPASRIVDRTCSARPTAPAIRTRSASSRWPLRRASVRRRRPRTCRAPTGPAGDPKCVVASTSPWVGRAGSGHPQPRMRAAKRARASRCPPRGYAAARPSSASGYRCPVAAAVLIRIRAAFRNPVTFSPAVDAPYLLTAKGRIVEGSLAVATKSKTPISFATVSRSGKAALFVAKPRCQFVK